MEKYIFLDIDGVIATSKTVKESSWDLTPECQKWLGFILKKTKAKIVLSSSWRLNSLEETKAYMIENGFSFTDSIIGITIRAYHYINKEQKIHLSIPRGVEIKQWLDTHVVYPWHAYPERDEEFKIYDENGNFKMMRHQELGIDYNFVILDDDSDMLLEQKDNFIKCQSSSGLTRIIAELAIEKLNKKNGKRS